MSQRTVELNYPMGITEEGLENSNFRFVTLTPYIWDIGDGVKNKVNNAGSANAFTDPVAFFKGLAAVVESAANTIEKTAAYKEAFYQSLKLARSDGNVEAYKINLPFLVSAMQGISHTPQWNEENSANAVILRNIGALIESVTAPLDKGGKTGVAGAITGVINKGKHIGGAAGALVSSKAQDFIISSMENLSLKLGNFGLAVYQPKRQMFQGVNPLSFKFDWELVPSSVEEASQIRHIIEVIRFFSYPDAGGTTAIRKAVIRQPALWKLEFPELGQGFENLIAKGNRFWCVIDSLDFQFGQPSDTSKLYVGYPDGTPNMIKMSVSLKEYFNPMDGQDRFGKLKAIGSGPKPTTVSGSSVPANSEGASANGQPQFDPGTLTEDNTAELPPG